MIETCAGLTGVEYVRFQNVTTIMMEDFIKLKVQTILDQQDCDQDHEVYCFPQVLGDTHNGIKYATMAICMSGVGNSDDSLYDKIKQFNYRPTINRGITNAIVKAYEFEDEKLRTFLENPKMLRGLALSPKDIDFLYQNRKLQAHSIQGRAYYMFYADIDRILDDMLMDPNTDDPVIPNYTTLSIKALGDKPDSPLSYDILLSNDPHSDANNAATVFKALISR